MKVIYVSGQYSNKSIDGVARNILYAELASVALWCQGWAVVCPHLNTRFFDLNYPYVPKQLYLKGDLEILKRCDAIYMLDNWKTSYGAKCEYRLANWLGLEIHYEE